MKTLYESILDDDTEILNHTDKKAKAYLKRKKKIDLVLDAFEDLILDWGLKFSYNANLGKYLQIGSKDAISRYFSKRDKTNKPNKQEFVHVYRLLKDKFIDIWDECIPEENLLLKSPSASFTFKDLGLKVWISLDNHSDTSFEQVAILYDKNDKYVEDVIDNIITKIS